MEVFKLDDLLGDKVTTLEVAKKEERIKFYNKCESESTRLVFKFSGVRNGDLFIEDNGVKIILPEDERIMSKYSNAPSLRTPYTVVVYKVDAEKNEVFVSVKRIMEHVRKTYVTEINNHLKDNIKVFVRAKVVYVDSVKQRVIVDIAGAGIRGYINIDEWRDSYVNSLRRLTKPGDIVNVVVLRKSKNRKLGYSCSRKQAVGGFAWKNIEERFPLKSAIKVKCMYLGKNEWFGSVDGLEDIDVYCQYPDEEDNITVSIGKEYICMVYNVSEADHQFRCRVIK